MMNKIINIKYYALLIVIFTTSGLYSSEQNSNNHYTLETIKTDFKNMAKANIDLTKKHTWLFLVTGSDEKIMIDATKIFIDKGFKPVLMYSESNESFYRLNLQTEKIYTPETLYKDTQTVVKLVSELKLRSFESLDIIK